MIPINEQPYPLPDGWQWVTLDSVAKIIMGQSPRGDATTDDASYTPLIGGAADMGDDSPSITRYTKKPTKLSKKDDVIICVRATLGKPIFSDGEYCLGRGVAALRPCTISKSFLKYALINFEQYLYDSANGTTFLQIASKSLKRMPFPLPPFDEQQRIVSFLDEVLAKLDETKALAQAVVDGSELRRTAILHKAFTGELTKLWRDEHETTLDSWKKKFLSDALISSKQKTNDFVSSDLKYVGLENMEKNGGRISFQAADEIRSTKNIFRIGDLLYGKLRPYLNKHGVAKFDGVCSTDILVFKANEQAEIEFINYFLSLPKFIEYAVANSKGINLPRVSEKIILRAEIFLPPLQEQKEIIRLLDDLLSREQRTKELAGKILERVELLEKSVSTRVFHGNLK